MKMLGRPTACVNKRIHVLNCITLLTERAYDMQSVALEQPCEMERKAHPDSGNAKFPIEK